MLLLKRHLVQLVREGKKRQTVRLWTRLMLRAGMISFTPGLGRMRILAVDELASLQDLTEADAHADGFPSRAALLAEVHRIYGSKIPAGRRIFRIRFDWPIDDLGRKLVLADPAPTLAAAPAPHALPPKPRSPKSPSAKIPRPRPRKSTSMSAAQRQQLRAYLLASQPA